MKKLDEFTMNLIKNVGFRIRIIEKPGRNNPVIGRRRDVRAIYDSPSPNRAEKLEIRAGLGEEYYFIACNELKKLIKSGYTLDSKDVIVISSVTIRLGTKGKVVYFLDDKGRCNEPVLFDYFGLYGNGINQYSEIEGGE